MIKPLSIATEGLIDDRSPLSIATRGLILIVPVEQVVIVKRPHGYWKQRELISFPWPDPLPIKVKIPQRMEAGRDIHKDDEQVLQILVESLINGLIH